ncbi:norbelladine synthase-like [Prosopis cineraria]|uniref:norbelladine synthase-like n=1 Tax=Prosopis cineraria TaxID=364024 RepID=UPI00240EB32E|nr:norbelladine synthase-like [Prosopis cineraria]
MSGRLEHELELDVPAGAAWDLFGTLRIVELAEKEMPSLFQKVELVDGYGGVGTILKFAFVPGTSGPSTYKEKIIKIDNENRIKETEIIEGGYLEIGFTEFRVRLHVIEKGEESSIIKSIVEYELRHGAPAKLHSIVSNSIQKLANIAQVAKLHLNKNNKLVGQQA